MVLGKAIVYKLMLLSVKNIRPLLDDDSQFYK